MHCQYTLFIYLLLNLYTYTHTHTHTYYGHVVLSQYNMPYKTYKNRNVNQVRK